MAFKTDRAEEAISAVTESLQKQITEKNAQISVTIGKHKMPIVNDFALLFYQSFLQTIDDYNLTKTEIRIILKLLEITQFGNLLKYSNTFLCNELSINKSNLSKSMKKLKEIGLILETPDGNQFLNPHIITKGKFNSYDEDSEYLLNISAEHLSPNVRPSILSNKMRQKHLYKSNNSDYEEDFFTEE